MKSFTVECELDASMADSSLGEVVAVHRRVRRRDYFLAMLEARARAAESPRIVTVFDDKGYPVAEFEKGERLTDFAWARPQTDGQLRPGVWATVQPPGGGDAVEFQVAHGSGDA